MSLIFTESVEVVNGSSLLVDKWNLTNQFSYISDGGATSRPPSNTAMYGTTAQFQARRVEAANEHATFIIGVAIRAAATAGASERIVEFVSDVTGSLFGGTLHVYFQTGASDATKIEAYRGDGTLLGSSASGVLTAAGVYQYLEFKVTLSDTVGVVVVRLDETIVTGLNLSGIDTKNGGTKTVFDSFALAGLGTSSRYDDLYVCNGAGSVNNDFLGAIHVWTVYPSGNGNSSGLTNSAGNSTNNYSYVDDAPFTVSDYVEGSSGEDTYAYTDIAFPTGGVAGVVVYAHCDKTDAGARGLSVVARVAGVESSVDVGPLTNGVNHIQWGIFDTEPGGGAWSTADYNSGEFGLKPT